MPVFRVGGVVIVIAVAVAVIMLRRRRRAAPEDLRQLIADGDRSYVNAKACRYT